MHSHQALEKEINKVGIARVDFILAHLLEGMSGLSKQSIVCPGDGYPSVFSIAHCLAPFLHLC
ncbi:MAG: hypothetical protein KME16_17745 [Scytolyngbya sp. HA4215-MV1]|jgi:hypothetical protein|nr:hypothetical protein [Scytolyngbya sp. HA4215-MV1]